MSFSNSFDLGLDKTLDLIWTLFDTVMVFMEEIFRNNDFDTKKLQMTKSMKNYPDKSS